MAETVESIAGSFKEGETQESVAELLEQLVREVSALILYESRLAASRYKPELRRTARGIGVALAVVVAFLTAFALANAAAVRALSTVLPEWSAPLALAAAWIAFAGLLALFLLARAKGVTEARGKSAEEARAEAEQAVRGTLERLAPAISKEIALAAVPMATEMASGVVDAGEEIIESADEIMETIADEVPGGGVVNQMWDVVLMPGRFGVRMATTVLRRNEPGD